MFAATTYDETAIYMCDVGYYMSSGDVVRTCRASGVWDGVEPICIQKIGNDRRIDIDSHFLYTVCS